LAESDNLLGLEEDEFEPGAGALPADDDVIDSLPVPPAGLLEWTPERAGAVVRAGGYLLHAADGLGQEPEGTLLWRATEEDIAAIGPPLARILNRYDAARRLAGHVDEGELGFAMAAYARRNLALRGRVAYAKKTRVQAAEEAAEQRPGWAEPDAGG